MVGKGHQVGVEPIRLETLQDEDIIPKKKGKGAVEPAHPSIPSIKLVEVYKQMPAVYGVSARDLGGRHSCCNHRDKRGCSLWDTR